MLDAKKIIYIIILLVAAILITINHTTDIFVSDNVSNNKISTVNTEPPPINNKIKNNPSSFINPIKNLVLKNNTNELIEYLNFVTTIIEPTENKINDENYTLNENYTLDENYTVDENYKFLEENILNSNIIWDGDINNIINPSEIDMHRLAAQFRYFAEFWLNKLNINSGFADVLDLNGIIGKYEFSRNKNVYTGKFNNYEWSWNINNKNYCFNRINSKRKNICMGDWIYVNGKCFPKATDNSTCNSYDWQKVANYAYNSEFDSLMKRCNITNSPNCINP